MLLLDDVGLVVLDDGAASLLEALLTLDLTEVLRLLLPPPLVLLMTFVLEVLAFVLLFLLFPLLFTTFGREVGVAT